MKKLTPAQQRVIDLMRDGWELTSFTHAGIPWLKRGAGPRSEYQKVHSGTFYSLRHRGLIYRTASEFPIDHYALMVS